MSTLILPDEIVIPILFSDFRFAHDPTKRRVKAHIFERGRWPLCDRQLLYDDCREDTGVLASSALCTRCAKRFIAIGWKPDVAG